MKCNYCKHFKNEIDICDFCNFEYFEELELYSDDWNILELDDDIEWSFKQIQYRLKAYNIDCLMVDVWSDDNIAYLIGCNANANRLATVLKMHRECIYDGSITGIIILNLFQEKYLRGLLEDDNN